MKFEQAIAALRDGKKVRRPTMFESWPENYIGLDGEYLMIYPNTNRCEIGKLPYVLCGKDILADDWEEAE